MVCPINLDGYLSYNNLKAMWTFKSASELRSPSMGSVFTMKHNVNISVEEKQKLLDIVKFGSSSAKIIRRAHTLLMSHEGKTDKIISSTLHISIPTVERTRKQFCIEGLEKTLKDRPRSGKPPKLTSDEQAYLIATTCSDAPCGRERWTLRLLADKMVSLEIVDSLGKSTVGRILKKTN